MTDEILHEVLLARRLPRTEKLHLGHGVGKAYPRNTICCMEK